MREMDEPGESLDWWFFPTHWQNMRSRQIGFHFPKKFGVNINIFESTTGQSWWLNHPPEAVCFFSSTLKGLVGMTWAPCPPVRVPRFVGNPRYLTG